MLRNQGRVVVLQGQLGLGGFVQSVAGKPELVGGLGTVAAGPGRVSAGQRHGWGVGRRSGGQSHPKKTNKVEKKALLRRAKPSRST